MPQHGPISSALALKHVACLVDAFVAPPVFAQNQAGTRHAGGCGALFHRPFHLPAHAGSHVWQLNWRLACACPVPLLLTPRARKMRTGTMPPPCRHTMTQIHRRCVRVSGRSGIQGQNRGTKAFFVRTSSEEIIRGVLAARLRSRARGWGRGVALRLPVELSRCLSLECLRCYDGVAGKAPRRRRHTSPRGHLRAFS